MERLAKSNSANAGWRLEAQGKLEEALRAYRDDFATAKQLVAIDPNNTKWQYDLSVCHERIGVVLMDQGDLASALKEDEARRDIISRLAAVDPRNMQWQRELSGSYNWVGNVLIQQGKLDEALKVYRDGLGIAERLTVADRSNAQWQSDLSVSYEKVGDVLVAQGKLDEALKSYRDGLAIRERLAAADKSNMQSQNDFQASIGKIGRIAYNFVLARDFAVALEAVDQAISLAPEKIRFDADRAHALIFLDRVEEARGAYLRYRGEKKVDGDKSWDAVVVAISPNSARPGSAIR